MRTDASLMLACEVRLSACHFLRPTASHLIKCQQFWQQLLQGIHAPAPCRDRYCAVDRCPAGTPVQVLCCDHHVSPCSATYSPTATTTKLSHLHSNYARGVEPHNSTAPQSCRHSRQAKTSEGSKQARLHAWLTPNLSQPQRKHNIARAYSHAACGHVRYVPPANHQQQQQPSLVQSVHSGRRTQGD